jgi:uncharacterized protein (DUF302 family)
MVRASDDDERTTLTCPGRLRMIEYGFFRLTDMAFEEAVEIVSEELKREGFGILTEIDLRDKFREKLGIEFGKYVILGACHPPSAHRAILAEENIGLMLPCNVIVYEKDEGTAISIIRPSAAMGMIDNDELREVAAGVEAKLRKVFDSIP